MCSHADGRHAGRLGSLIVAVAGAVAIGVGSLLSAGRAAGQQPAKLDKAAVEKLTPDWLATPKEVAKRMIGQYGPPDEATPTHLWSGARTARGSTRSSTARRCRITSR